MQMEQTGTPEAELASTPITEAPGISSGEYEFSKSLEAFSRLGEALDENLGEWAWYMNKRDLLTEAALGELVFHPSLAEAKTIAIFRVDGYSSGNRQVDVIWTWGEISPTSVHALTKAATSYAKSEGAGRIFLPACKSLYKSLLPEGFKVSKVQMIKEL